MQIAAATLGVPLEMVDCQPTTATFNHMSSATGGSIASDLNCYVSLSFTFHKKTSLWKPNQTRNWMIRGFLPQFTMNLQKLKSRSRILLSCALGNWWATASAAVIKFNKLYQFSRENQQIRIFDALVISLQAVKKACEKLLDRITPVKAQLPKDTPWYQVVFAAFMQGVELQEKYM